MIEDFAVTYRRGVVQWVDLARRGALLVVIASLAAAGLGLVYVADNLSINTDTTDMLSPDLPFRRDSRAISEAFPQFSDNILVVLDGQTPDLADDAAMALAGRLRLRPEIFGDVYDPMGDPFFRRNGLLFEELDELVELGDRLAEAQPFLGVLWQDPSLRGLFKMVEMAIDEIRQAGEAPIDVAPVLEAIAHIAEEQARGRFAHLSWQELMTTGKNGDGGGESVNRRILVISPVLDFASLQPAGDAIGALRSLAAEMGLDGGHGVGMRLTGSAALAQEELKSVEEGMGLAALVSLFLVLVLLLSGLRSVRLSAALLATLIMGLVWTAAFALAVLGRLNLISVAFAVLFIGLSVDFGIHFGLRYKEEIDRRAAPAEALRHAAAGAGGALGLCAVAAAIAFYSFLPTDYLGLAELGLIAGTGMFIALFANLTVLPALLSLFPLAPAPVGAEERKPGGVQPFVRRHAGAVAWGALVLGAAAAAVAPGARFDFDPLNLKDPGTESVGTLFDLMEDPRTGPYSITVLAASLAEADRLAARLEGLDEVDGAETLSDYLPGDQAEKLEIVESLALFLSPSLSASRRQPPPAPEERRVALDSLLGKLERLQTEPARRVGAALSGLPAAGREGALAELEVRLLAALPGRLETLRRSLEAEPVSLDSLPPSLRQRQLTADGRARLTVYPQENLHDRAALKRFVKAVRTVAPRAAGSPVVILEAGNTVIRAFVEAALLAVSLIGLLLVVVLRSAKDVALVFAPLSLAALLTIAASVLFGLPFNFANVIVLPLLFGLGVAGAIHLVLRQRSEASRHGVLETSTPRAVMFSALTTIGSFGSIALSSHPGTSSMGVLLTIAITLSLACTLVVLPALLAIFGPSRSAKARPQ